MRKFFALLATKGRALLAWQLFPVALLFAVSGSLIAVAVVTAQPAAQPAPFASVSASPSTPAGDTSSASEATSSLPSRATAIDPRIGSPFVGAPRTGLTAPDEIPEKMTSATTIKLLIDEAEVVSFTELQTDLDAGRIKRAWIDDTNKAVLAERSPGDPIVVYFPADYLEALLGDFVDAGVPVSVGPDAVEPRPERDAYTGYIVMILLAILGGLWIAGAQERRRNGNAPNASQQRPGSPVSGALPEGSIPTTRFSDVAGAEEAVADMAELVEFLKDPERFERTGAKAPRGALLVGPPGTGKTLLARAVAGEAGVPFFTANGSDFVEMYVGVGARRVRDLFAKARVADRAIVFIDEIDAVARKRSSDGQTDNSERENTLIALMTEMDGFSTSRVIVLAATNREDVLDPAITRPGRLDRKIAVPNPDRRGRERILAVHAKGKPIGDDVDFVLLARRTPGMSGAVLEQIVNEACMEAARRNLEVVTAACFDAAIATIAMGRARTSALVTDADRAVTAWHEAGHTVCALLQPDADDPVSVSIVPRGPAGGVTWMSGNDDIFLSRKKAVARMVTAMGGRAAEEILMDGEYTQGAHGDLTSATNIATAMVTQYGMSRLGLMVRSDAALAYGGMEKVNEVVEELLADALDEARRLLREHRDLLEAFATELLDAETLGAEDIAALAAKVGSSRRDGRVLPARAEAPVPTATSAVVRPSAAPVAPSRPGRSRAAGAGAAVVGGVGVASRALRRRVARRKDRGGGAQAPAN